MADELIRKRDDDRERRLIRAKAGRAIAIIGLLGSTFWLALLAGATRKMLLLTAAHTAIVVLIGIGIAAKSRSARVGKDTPVRSEK